LDNDGLGPEILKALFASATVVLSHEMSIRFDCLTAYAHDDVGKMAMQAATFTARIFGLKPLGVVWFFTLDTDKAISD
jgi:hypothetical protein